MNMYDDKIKIELQYNSAISVVSGRPNGISCYNDQMKQLIETNIFDINKEFLIIFPQGIKLISGSYLLGMFEDINNIIGIEGIKNRFSFESSTGDNLQEILLDELKRSGC